MTAIGPDLAVKIGADLKGRQVIVVLGRVAQGVLAITILLATAVDHPSPAHRRGQCGLVFPGQRVAGIQAFLANPLVQGVDHRPAVDQCQRWDCAVQRDLRTIVRYRCGGWIGIRCRVRVRWDRCVRNWRNGWSRRSWRRRRLVRPQKPGIPRAAILGALLQAIFIRPGNDPAGQAKGIRVARSV
ncbi:hypothetical protein D3C76_1019500 [compost metagenome]